MKVSKKRLKISHPDVAADLLLARNHDFKILMHSDSRYSNCNRRLKPTFSRGKVSTRRGELKSAVATYIDGDLIVIEYSIRDRDEGSVTFNV